MQSVNQRPSLAVWPTLDSRSSTATYERLLPTAIPAFLEYSVMSFEPVMPPWNSSDPGASFLSSSCLDFLLIELVPLAYRVTQEKDTAPPESKDAAIDMASTSHGVSSSAGVVTGPGSRKMDEDEELDAVHYRLDILGYRVGQGLVERFRCPGSYTITKRLLM